MDKTQAEGLLKKLVGKTLKPYDVQVVEEETTLVFSFSCDKSPRKYSSTFNLPSFETQLQKIETGIKKELKATKVEAVGSSISGVDIFIRRNS